MGGQRRPSDRFLVAAQDLGHLPVRRGDPGAAIRDEQHRVGLHDGHDGLIPDLLDEISRADRKGCLAAMGGVNAARIDNVERDIIPFRFGYQPVAGGAGNIVHDGQAFTGQAVEERAFAHVGASNQGNNRFVA